MKAKKIRSRLLQSTTIVLGLSIVFASENADMSSLLDLSSGLEDRIVEAPGREALGEETSTTLVDAAFYPIELARELSSGFDTGTGAAIREVRSLRESLPEMPRLFTPAEDDGKSLFEAVLRHKHLRPRHRETAVFQTPPSPDDAVKSTRIARAKPARELPTHDGARSANRPPEMPSPRPKPVTLAEADTTIPLPPEKTEGERAPIAELAALPELPARCQGAAEIAGAVAGDRLSLRVFERSDPGPEAGGGFDVERLDLSGTFEVDADGNLPLPGLGRLPVTGLDLQCIEAAIARLFADEMHARAAVNASFADRPDVMVSGAVRRPGAFSFTPGMDVGTLMARAGAAEGDAARLATMQRRADLVAQRAELDRLALGIALEGGRLAAAFDGESSLELDEAQRRRVEAVLGRERLETELAALSTSMETLKAHEARERSRIDALDRRIEAEAEAVKIIEAQIATAETRLAELRKRHDDGAAGTDKIENAEDTVLSLEREKAAARSEMLRLDAERAAAVSRLDVAAAERRERLAREIRDSAARLDALLAQREALDIRIAALDAMDEARRAFAFRIERRTPDGVAEIEADPETLLLPGDIATVMARSSDAGPARRDGSDETQDPTL